MEADDVNPPCPGTLAAPRRRAPHIRRGYPHVDEVQPTTTPRGGAWQILLSTSQDAIQFEERWF
jgi:hypothetical protein